MIALLWVWAALVAALLLLEAVLIGLSIHDWPRQDLIARADRECFPAHHP